jgi:DNA polymerase-3 subunit delta'
MSFGDIYGHESQKEILRNTLARKRTAHAYLFSGIPGIGKKALALEFIKAVNCAQSDTLHDACGTCDSCRRIQRSSHPDVFFVEAEGQFIRIASIRQIQERAKCRPLEAKKRAFMIDDSDKMNEESANALLKMLEEPSASNILILITARPYAMPQTIISRCQHLRFNPLSAETVKRFLVSSMEMDHQKALLPAALSGGSIGSALELNQEDIFAYRKELLDLLSSTTRQDPFSLIQFASFLGQKKKEIRQGLKILVAFFRDVLVFKEVGKKDMLINQDHASLVSSCAGRLSGVQILQNIEHIERAGDIIDQNVNKSLTLETMAFKLNYSETRISETK